MKVNTKLVHINLSIPFTHLAAIGGPDDNLVDHFEFDLKQKLTSLFKDGVMRKPDKSVLRNVLLSFL